ncbi:MAG: DUF3108 domain-containing protein [Pseudomonadota bacterium]
MQNLDRRGAPDATPPLASPAQPTRPGPPLRRLALLTLAVVGAHLLLLREVPQRLDLAGGGLKPERLVFETRQIELPSPPTPVARRAPAPRPRPSSAVPQKPQLEAPPPASLPESTIAAAAPVSEATPLPEAPLTPSAPPVPEQPPPASAALAAPRIPGSVRLDYAMTGQSKSLQYSAKGVLNWIHDGEHYNASLVVSAFMLGSRAVSSVGAITADGLAPSRYSEQRRGELATHFQPEKGLITFSNNRPDVPWQAGAQDRLSVFMQISGLLASDPARFQPGTRLPIYTAGPRDADLWSFSVESSQALDLPIGTMQAIKLTRDPRREFDQKVEAWFAPELGYLPVRIRVTQANGDFLEQQLSSTAQP